jgi:hypothetical protein
MDKEMSDAIFGVATKALLDISADIKMEGVKRDETGFEVILNEGGKQTVIDVREEPASEDPRQKGVFILKVSGVKEPQGFVYTSEGLVIFAGVLKKLVNKWRETVAAKQKSA